MIGLIPKRLRWMAIGAGVSYVSKRKAGRTVDRATERLEAQLPEPVARVAQALPGEVVRGAGALIAASEAARKSASVARTAAGATGTAISAGRTAGGAVKSVSGSMSRHRMAFGRQIAAVADDLKVQSELDRRELKADYLRHTEGDGPALEALLDLRADEGSTNPGPLPETPDAVPAGRRRYRPALPSAPVNRVQRSYRRSTKPWDR